MLKVNRLLIEIEPGSGRSAAYNRKYKKVIVNASKMFL